LEQEAHHGLLWSDRPIGSPSKSYKPDYVIVQDATIFKGGIVKSSVDLDEPELIPEKGGDLAGKVIV